MKLIAALVVIAILIMLGRKLNALPALGVYSTVLILGSLLFAAIAGFVAKANGHRFDDWAGYGILILWIVYTLVCLFLIFIKKDGGLYVEGHSDGSTVEKRKDRRYYRNLGLFGLIVLVAFFIMLYLLNILHVDIG